MFVVIYGHNKHIAAVLSVSEWWSIMCECMLHGTSDDAASWTRFAQVIGNVCYAPQAKIQMINISEISLKEL